MTLTCELCGETVSRRFAVFVTPDPDLPRDAGAWVSVCTHCRDLLR